MEDISKKAKTFLVTFLLVLFLLTSGLVFEVLGRESSSGIDLPYSIGLSNNRLNFSGSYTDSDNAVLDCLDKLEITGTIWTDYNGATLLHEKEVRLKFGIHNWDYPPLVNEYYLFITSWSYENGKFVFGRLPGIRWLVDIPNYNEDCLVCIEGTSRIYKVILEGD